MVLILCNQSRLFTRTNPNSSSYDYSATIGRWLWCI